MKKVILMLSFLALVFAAHGQSKSVDALYQKYKGNDDFFHLDIGGNFMNFAEGFNVKLDQSKMEGVVKSLEKVKLFKLPENLEMGNQEFKALRKSLEKERYELMMETKDKGDEILIFSKGDKVISDVVVLVKDDEGDLIVVELAGAFDAKTLAEAGKALR